jgi:fumarate hydratase subunit alpha
VRYVEFEKIAEQVESLCIAACYELPDDVVKAIEAAAENESNPAAARILQKLIENARLAADQRIPLCQDTGLAVVFAEQGADFAVKPPAGSEQAPPPGAPGAWGQATLVDAINSGVASGYEKGFLRKSVVGDPLKARANTGPPPRQSRKSRKGHLAAGGSNTPAAPPPVPKGTPCGGALGPAPWGAWDPAPWGQAIIHHRIVPGDKLKLTVMAKGGGCENKSQFKMFKPTAEKEDVIAWVVNVVRTAGADACPPFVVGVGIGGDFEVSCLLSKRALLRNLGETNGDEFYAAIEADLLAQINALGLGPQGLGGDTTALAVMIETAPCHIASLPVAVNIECHSHRHKSAII